MRVLLSLIVPAYCLSAQLVSLVEGREGESRNVANIELSRIQAAPAKTGPNKIYTMTGDSVIPQLVDGAGWKTTMVFYNIDSKTVKFAVDFISDSGTDLYVNVAGVGRSRGVTITLPVNQSITVETMGEASELAQGFAYIDRENSSDRVTGLAVFKQRTPGRADQEAVVPIVSEFDDRFILLYDNTQGYTTSMAIANPEPWSQTANIIVRDEDGKTLKTTSMTIEKFKHQAFSIAATWPETAGRRGSIEFTATKDGFGFGVLGLRFHPSGSFTSFHVLSNIDWIL